METRLYNIFKRKIATKLAKSILKSSIRNNFIYDLKPVHFLWTVKFLAAFNLQINITLVVFWEKLQNNIY